MPDQSPDNSEAVLHAMNAFGDSVNEAVQKATISGVPPEGILTVLDDIKNRFLLICMKAVREVEQEQERDGE